MAKKATLDVDFRKLQREERRIERTSEPLASSAKIETERVNFVMSSGAGSGSGEFHKYRASRNAELERIRLMEEEARAQAAQKEYDRQVDEREQVLRSKQAKRAAKRAKSKEKQRELRGVQKKESVLVRRDAAARGAAEEAGSSDGTASASAAVVDSGSRRTSRPLHLRNVG